LKVSINLYAELGEIIYNKKAFIYTISLMHVHQWKRNRCSLFWHLLHYLPDLVIQPFQQP